MSANLTPERLVANIKQGVYNRKQIINMVDRIDNTKGYVKGNVVACTHIANQLKEMLVENKDSPFKDNTRALKKFIEKL